MRLFILPLLLFAAPIHAFTGPLIIPPDAALYGLARPSDNDSLTNRGCGLYLAMHHAAHARGKKVSTRQFDEYFKRHNLGKNLAAAAAAMDSVNLASGTLRIATGHRWPRGTWYRAAGLTVLNAPRGTIIPLRRCKWAVLLGVTRERAYRPDRPVRMNYKLIEHGRVRVIRKELTEDFLSRWFADGRGVTVMNHKADSDRIWYWHRYTWSDRRNWEGHIGRQGNDTLPAREQAAYLSDQERPGLIR